MGGISALFSGEQHSCFVFSWVAFLLCFQVGGISALFSGGQHSCFVFRLVVFLLCSTLISHTLQHFFGFLSVQVSEFLFLQLTSF
jgi:hypothetical protein